MSDALFSRDGDLFIPSAHTRGPWSAEQQHGGAPAALLADMVGRAEGGEEMVVCRLTYEFLGPVPLVPLKVAVRVAKAGRRFQLLEGELIDVDGRVLVRVRGVRLRRGAVELGDAANSEPTPRPGPEASTPGSFETGGVGFGSSATESRWAQGELATVGPARVWFRLAMPLVAGETPTATARVAAAADFGNGVSRLLDFRTHFFINTDLTIHLVREPKGEWVLIDARTQLDPQGTGVASSRLYDQDGPIGVAAQTLFVDVR